MNTRSFLLSALIAGAFIGLFGNLPLLNLLNCFICMWVWLGGILVVYLYRRFQKGEVGLSVGQAAGLGAVAGLVGVVIGTPIYALTSFLSAPMMERIVQALQIQGSTPFGGSPTILGTLVFFLVDLVLYPIFGAVGAMIAVSLIWKKPPAQQI